MHTSLALKQPLGDLQAHARRDAVLRMLAFGIALATLGGSLLVSFLVTPQAIESGSIVLWPTCAYRELFGRPCPTCGLTRAFSAISHGDVAQALQYHRGSLWIYGTFWLGALGSAAMTLLAAWQRYGLRRNTAPKSH
ncbi:MAG: DUF2752 domain-containing protein [Polyangiaceae bacterium]